MVEPSQQIEVQLGHLCNNRCVFCVSGQLSEQDRAPQLPEAPIRRQIEAARARGAEKITFLGGEPTIQRSFLGLLKRAVELDFREIVIFTNGVMTPRDSFRERVLRIVDALGSDARQRLIWRFSLQGGDRESHDATTVNPGAWERIVESMAILHDQGARLTGNMCVVAGNHASIPKLAEVAQRFDFENIHLDMFRPRDSGDRTEAYLTDLMRVPYSEMAQSFRTLVSEVDERLGEGFDLNVGNMPYCIAPDIAWRIHHDGEDTVTVAASGSGTTQEGFNKYLDKRTDKHKLPSCDSCVFQDRCGGVFDLYAKIHGHDELVPVTADQLWETDQRGHHFVLLAQQNVRQWAAANERRKVGRIDERNAEIDVSEEAPGGEHWRLVLRRSGRGGERSGWWSARGERLEAVLVGAPPTNWQADAEKLAASLMELASELGDRAFHASIDGLEAAWAEQAQRLLAHKQQRARTRQRAARLIDRLRGQRIAGMKQTSVQRVDDGQVIEVAFELGAQRVVLSIGLSPSGDASRPSLSHRAERVGREQLRAFNAGLGALLRARARDSASALQ